MERRKFFFKEAGTLLIGVLLICTSVAAISTITDKTKLITPSCEITSPIKNPFPSQLQDDVILWDNYVLSWCTAYHSQDEPPGDPPEVDSFVADDFMFEEETEVHWVFWQFMYWNCNNVEGPKDYHYDWNITFFEDDGTGNSPGDIYKSPITIADADIDKSLPYINSTTDANGMWVCGGTAFLPEPVTFNADTKYWLTIYSTGPIFPQTGWCMHCELHGGILLHEAKFKSEHWGYPDWTNFTIVNGEPLDSSFVLGGDHPFEITISKGLGVTASVTNNLPENEDFTIENLTTTFTATGGFVLNPTKTVVIPEFNEGTTETIKWFPIGIGRITIEVYCTSTNVGIGTAKDTGLLLLFFVL
jgi:hypothetical protein